MRGGGRARYVGLWHSCVGNDEEESSYLTDECGFGVRDSGSLGAGALVARSDLQTRWIDRWYT